MTDSSENSEGFEDLKKKVLEKLRKFYRYIRKKKKTVDTKLFDYYKQIYKL